MGKAEMNGEMMEDAFDMMENPATAADAEEVYSSILGELEMEINDGTAVSTKKIAQKKMESA